VACGGAGGFAAAIEAVGRGGPGDGEAGAGAGALVATPVVGLAVPAGVAVPAGIPVPAGVELEFAAAEAALRCAPP
jgi:hypothetical protein